MRLSHDPCDTGVGSTVCVRVYVCVCVYVTGAVRELVSTHSYLDLPCITECIHTCSVRRRTHTHTHTGTDIHT